MARKILLIVVVALIFGGLMAYRSELSSTWSRAIMSGLAFVILGLGIMLGRRLGARSASE